MYHSGRENKKKKHLYIFVNYKVHLDTIKIKIYKLLSKNKTYFVESFSISKKIFSIYLIAKKYQLFNLLYLV